MAAPNEELFAQHAARLRRPLLHAYRYAAPREDLQDIYAQAVLELLLRVRRDSTFNTPRHFAAALELRFKSRIADRHRALGGRSAGAAAFEHAVRLDDPAAAVRGWFDVEREVIARERLRTLVRAVEQLPALKRDALLSEHVTGETERKRRQRVRAKLRDELGGGDV